MTLLHKYPGWCTLGRSNNKGNLPITLALFYFLDPLIKYVSIRWPQGIYISNEWYLFLWLNLCFVAFCFADHKLYQWFRLQAFRIDSALRNLSVLNLINNLYERVGNQLFVFYRNGGMIFESSDSVSIHEFIL